MASESLENAVTAQRDAALLPTNVVAGGAIVPLVVGMGFIGGRKANRGRR